MARPGVAVHSSTSSGDRTQPSFDPRIRTGPSRRPVGAVDRQRRATHPPRLDPALGRLQQFRRHAELPVETGQRTGQCGHYTAHMVSTLYV